MKISTIKKLSNLFAGKVVTIITLGTNKPNIPDTQFADFYTGVLEEMDEDGIILTHLLTACKSFFALSGVVAIMEEQVLDENNPENKEEIQKIKEQILNKRKQQMQEVEVPSFSNENSDFNDIEGLDKLAEFAKHFNAQQNQQ